MNEGFSAINEAIGGGLEGMGLTENDGVDFTLYASKMLTFLPRPVLVNLGGRATKSVELGLLGFTDEHSFVFEGSVVVLVTDPLKYFVLTPSRPVSSERFLDPGIGPEFVLEGRDFPVAGEQPGFFRQGHNPGDRGH